MNLPMIQPIKAFTSLAFFGMFAQIAPVIPAVGPLDSIGRLSLDGALIIAVGVLWRSLNNLLTDKDAKIAAKDAAIAAKDEQLLTMAVKVTDTMALVMASVHELRKTTEELGTAMDNLSDNIAAIPCAAGYPSAKATKQAEKADQVRRLGHIKGTP